MSNQSIELSDKSQVTIPLRNLITLVMAVAFLITGYLSVTERINFLEHNAELMDVHVQQNSEFRIKWPRGELGSLPADAEQNMRLNHLEEQLDAIIDDLILLRAR
jgi:hypothetical protein